MCIRDRFCAGTGTKDAPESGCCPNSAPLCALVRTHDLEASAPQETLFLSRIDALYLRLPLLVGTGQPHEHYGLWSCLFTRRMERPPCTIFNLYDLSWGSEVLFNVHCPNHPVRKTPARRRLQRTRRILDTKEQEILIYSGTFASAKQTPRQARINDPNIMVHPHRTAGSE